MAQNIPHQQTLGYTVDYCAIYVHNKSASKSIGQTDQLVEAASTIKIPIFILACLHNEKSGHTLNHTLQQLSQHSSNGSGILEWATYVNDYHTVRELLYYMMSYSDCVATNILIDYVGGKQAINTWLEQHNFTTRLVMPYITFSPEKTTESVGITTAREMSRLVEILFTHEWHPAYSRLAKVATSTLGDSWVGEKLPEKFPGIQGKTGSMVNCTPHNNTYLNIAGSLPGAESTTVFSMVACGQADDEVSLEKLKDAVLLRLIATLKAFLPV